jgi:hypothetical protein
MLGVEGRGCGYADDCVCEEYDAGTYDLHGALPYIQEKHPVGSEELIFDIRIIIGRWIKVEG